jgi:hypothetical protein
MRYRLLKATMTKERLFVGSVLVLGCVVRFLHFVFMGVNLPHKGGGLFVEFAQQIALNGFALPRYIPFYSIEGIPFAYPPLPFYVEAVLIHVFSLPKFLVANLLPPCIAILTLLAFYWLIRELELEFWARIVALLAHATMVSAYAQQIVAGGLSEAFGSLALVCLAIFLVRVYQRGTFVNYGLVGLAWAFCVVASPGSAYASVPVFGIFVVVQFAKSDWRPGLRTVAYIVAAGLIAVVASSPYWLTVIGHHGLRVFVISFGEQHKVPDLETWEELLAFQITGAKFLWNFMLFCGIAWAVLRRRWVLLAWFCILYSIPREGDWMVSAPAAILAGLGATEVFAPPLFEIAKRYKRRTEMIILVGVLILSLLLSFYLETNERIHRHAISPKATSAMMWVEANTPPDGKFIVLVDDDPVLEWSPQIMQRTVINVHYGAEFTVEAGKWKEIKRLDKKLDNCSDFECVQSRLLSSDAFSSSGAQSDVCSVHMLLSQARLADLTSSSVKAAFRLMWENDEIAVGMLSFSGSGCDSDVE